MPAIPSPFLLLPLAGNVKNGIKNTLFCSTGNTFKINIQFIHNEILSLLLTTGTTLLWFPLVSYHGLGYLFTLVHIAARFCIRTFIHTNAFLKRIYCAFLYIYQKLKMSIQIKQIKIQSFLINKSSSTLYSRLCHSQKDIFQNGWFCSAMFTCA